MDEPADIQHQEESDLQKPAKKRSDLFGQNFLGITYIAPDFDEDLPIEFFLGEDTTSESDVGETS
jgi:hypothetical protein